MYAEEKGVHEAGCRQDQVACRGYCATDKEADTNLESGLAVDIAAARLGGSLLRRL